MGTPVKASLANEAIRAEPTEAMTFLLVLAEAEGENTLSCEPITLSLTNSATVLKYEVIPQAYCV